MSVAFHDQIDHFVYYFYGVQLEHTLASELVEDNGWIGNLDQRKGPPDNYK